MRRKLLTFFLSLSMAGALLSLVIVILIIQDLPDVTSLQYVSYKMPMRIYSADNELFGEFGHTNREPVSYEEIPKDLIHALVATEDQRFYTHPGVDVKGILRAGIVFLKNGQKSQGASTITMQVARNFFLHRKKTWLRKLKEIVLAYQIDQYYTKEQILTLYLNEIFFGNHAYGIKAASHKYYGKDLNQLALHEMAMLAGLPKAASAYNPIINPEKATKRRNHVLRRMYEESYINEIEYELARKQDDVSHRHDRKRDFEAPHVADMIRQYLYNIYGEEAYTRGFEVVTTIKKSHQLDAQSAVRKNLENLQNQIGPQPPRWLRSKDFNLIKLPEGKESIFVLAHDDTHVYYQGLPQGPQRTTWSDFLKNVPQQHHASVQSWPNTFWVITEKNQLTFEPENEAAIIITHAPTGAITALIGGYDYEKSAFNRVTQAWRQIGSVVKPFILAAGLEAGFNLADQIMDGPVVVDGFGAEPDWRPNNVDLSFRGLMRLRDGVVYSRNLVMVRLLSQISMNNVIQLLSRFGFNSSKQNDSLSLALGSGIATPSQVVAAYIPFLDSGNQHTPFIISSINDQVGPVVPLSNDIAPSIVALQEPSQPILTDQRAYLVYDVLRDVVQKGTARRIKALNRNDMIGKTGTTNQQRDAWFVGSVGPYIATVWVGNDQSVPIKKYGSQVATPMWIDAVSTWQKNVDIWRPERPPYLMSKRHDSDKGFEIFEHYPTDQDL